MPMAMMMPITRLIVERLSDEARLKLSIRESIAATIVLTCVAFPVPNTVRTPKREKRKASQCQCLERPFLMCLPILLPSHPENSFHENERQVLLQNIWCTFQEGLISTSRKQRRFSYRNRT